jgi:hypothetical protein
MWEDQPKTATYKAMSLRPAPFAQALHQDIRSLIATTIEKHARADTVEGGEVGGWYPSITLSFYTDNYI